ncbi:MAG: hypothetical protein K8F91_26110, partial [Candidatus Obscuribacterales bacterium]|nr:hypothetical protein [Candidatus Obscuribacterales bacterium]
VMLKVIEHQLSLPVAAVGEDELGKSLELLEWCAGEDSQIVAIQKDRVKQWFERRELNIAHNLVGQGQFGPAINIFEKYEGKDGPNVVSVLELWVMKYLMVALIEGDRLRVTTTDGYAFGCAIEIINTLKDRDVLRPEFAMQVAELIIKAAPWGMRQHIRQICTMFGSTGGEFLESAARLEAFCSSKSTSSYHLSSVVGKGAGSDAGSAGQSLDALNVDSDLSQLWTGLHRALFLIDREQYQEAIKVLTAFEKLDLKGEFLSDAYIGIGYCNYLLDDIESSEQFFKRAVHASRDRDRHKFYRAAVALAYFIKTPALSKPQLRKLVDPSVDYKEVLRIAAQLRGRPIDFNENLALNLANLLYGEASKTEQTQNTVNARARYKAALTIYGTEQEEFWSEVVDCLDAVGQYASAASRLKDATSRNLGMSDTAENLLMKIARRHVKEEQVSRILSFYESMGISLARYIDVAEREFIVQSLSKILISKVPPKRLLSQVTRDLNTMFSDDKLDPPFCITVARFIESNIVFCSEARRQKCREDLLKIGRVLSRVNSRALEVIQDCLKPSEEEKAGGEPKDGETIMESLF